MWLWRNWREWLLLLKVHWKNTCKWALLDWGRSWWSWFWVGRWRKGSKHLWCSVVGLDLGLLQLRLTSGVQLEEKNKHYISVSQWAKCRNIIRIPEHSLFQSVVEFIDVVVSYLYIFSMMVSELVGKYYWTWLWSVWSPPINQRVFVWKLYKIKSI